MIPRFIPHIDFDTHIRLRAYLTRIDQGTVGTSRYGTFCVREYRLARYPTPVKVQLHRLGHALP